MYPVRDLTTRYLKKFVVKSALLKIASRCNLNCSYCYWFEDGKVHAHPSILTLETESLFLHRLDEHLSKYSLKQFTIYLHGGEPLLFGKQRFASLCRRLRILESKRKTKIQILVQTNGVLIDDDWANIFRILQVAPSISIDGPEHIHDSVRKQFNGSGSQAQAVRGLKLLQKHGLNPGILAVFSEGITAENLCSFFVEELNVNWFDVLFPDPVVGKPKPRLGNFYQDLFDCWFFKYKDRGVTIRVVENFLEALGGNSQRSDAIGYSPFTTFTITTSGKFETCDTFHSLDGEIPCTTLDLKHNPLQDIAQGISWLDALDASLNLCDKCNSCNFKSACGGGYIPHRWNDKNGFNNPSIYCNELINIFTHISQKVGNEIIAPL